MLTSFDLPDDVYHHLKTTAALEGMSLRDMIVAMVELGLGARRMPRPEICIPGLPTMALGAPMALAAADLTHARLCEMLHE